MVAVGTVHTLVSVQLVTTGNDIFFVVYLSSGICLLSTSLDVLDIDLLLHNLVPLKC